MLRTVILEGVLGERFGREWHLHIRSPIEAVRAIAHQVDGFAEFLATSADRGIEYQVFADDPLGCDEETVIYPCAADVVTIAPVIAGGGGSAGIRIIVGAVLIGLAVFSGGTSILGLSAMTVGLMGASLVLSGISQLLTPTPEQPDETERQTSSIIDSANRTTDQGKPVPVPFGRRRFDLRIVLSAAVDVEQEREEE